MIQLQFGLRPQSTTLFYTTTGWVMWNILLASLLGGGSIVLYDGSPVYPSTGTLWQLAEDTGATCFGASSTYLQMIQKSGLAPGRKFGLARLDTILAQRLSCTMPETYDWVYRNVKRDLWINSTSGGTGDLHRIRRGCRNAPHIRG